MTEHEYTIEMLCCIPMYILQQRMSRGEQVPSWLERMDDAIVQEAIDRYNEQPFAEARKESMAAL